MSTNAIDLHTKEAQAHENYKHALMRHRYSNGADLNDIAQEFSVLLVDLERVLGELLSADDKTRLDLSRRAWLYGRGMNEQQKDGQHA